MKDEFFWQDNEEESEEKALIEKFDSMIATEKVQFFDLDDFETAVDFYISRGEMKKAEKAILFGLQLHPTAISLSIKRGESYYLDGKLNKALDILLKASQVDNKNPDLLSLIASIYSQQHQSDKAIQFYERALNNNPEDPDSLYIELATELQFNNQHNKAIPLLKKALVDNPKNEAAIFDLYHCYSVTNRLKECLEYFTRFIDNHPYSFSAWYNLGMCYLKMNKEEKAIDAFYFCIAIEKNIYLPYHQIASIHYENEEYTKALDVYKDCLEADENSSTTYTYIGECYEKLEHYELAEMNYKKAIELNENAAEAWLGLGIVKTLTKEPKLALPYFDKALSIDPDNSFYWFQLADTYHYELNIPEKAREAYEASLELYADDHHTWLNYVELLLKNFSATEAYEAVLESAKVGVNKPHIHFMIAACQLKMKELESCLLSLEKGFAENPKNINTFMELTEYRDLTEGILELIDLHKK